MSPLWIGTSWKMTKTLDEGRAWARGLVDHLGAAHDGKAPAGVQPFVIPSFTATTTMLSVLVPAQARGEAFGWHGSMITGGAALTAPAIGLVIDRSGWPVGFVAGGLVSVLLGLAQPLAHRFGRRQPVG